MISHKYKFIFIQIPKTACTSVEHILTEYGCGRIRQGKDFWDDIDFKHITFDDLETRLDTDTLSAYFKFAFVRNPFDWLVSNYHYCRGIHVPYLKRNIFDKNDAKKNPHGNNRDCINFIAKNKQKFNSMQISSMEFKEWIHWYVNNVHGTQFEMIQDLNKKNRMDMIGKMENLQEDFNIICDKIGIPRQQIPHLNETKHKHYTEYYDNETREMIEEKYAKDIEYFGYNF